MKLDPSAFVAGQELIEELEVHSLRLFCPTDRVLFHQGDAPVGLFILNKGVATLTRKSRVGEALTYAQSYAGSVFWPARTHLQRALQLDCHCS